MAANDLELAVAALPEADRIVVGPIVALLRDMNDRLEDCITAVGLLNRVDTMRAEQIAKVAEAVDRLTPAEESEPEPIASRNAYWAEVQRLREEKEEAAFAETLSGWSDSTLVEEWQIARTLRETAPRGTSLGRLAELDREVRRMASEIVSRSARRDDERRLAENDDQRDYAEERYNAALLREEWDGDDQRDYAEERYNAELLREDWDGDDA